MSRLTMHGPPMTDEEVVRALAKDARSMGLFMLVGGVLLTALMLAFYFSGVQVLAILLVVGVGSVGFGILLLVRPQPYMKHPERVASVSFDGLRRDHVTVTMDDGQYHSVAVGGFTRERVVTAFENVIARARLPEATIRR